MAIASVGKSDIDAFRASMAAIGQNVRVWAKDGTKVVAEVIVEVGRSNLRKREGGGKYTRSVAHVELLEDDSGFSAGLITPWFGMEFGGYITNVWSGTAVGGFNRIGSSRSSEIGLEPMWAPWHKDAAQGYIIGKVWTELDQGKADAAIADVVLAGYSAEFDKAGLKGGPTGG